MPREHNDGYLSGDMRFQELKKISFSIFTAIFNKCENLISFADYFPAYFGKVLQSRATFL